MLHKASKQAIYNSIYEEGIYNNIFTLLFFINNNIEIEERNDYYDRWKIKRRNKEV